MANLFLGSVGKGQAFRYKKQEGGTIVLEPAFTAKTLTDSSINISVSKDDVRGGEGASIQYDFFHDPTVEINLTDIEFKKEYITAQLGAKFRAGVGVTAYQDENVTFDNSTMSSVLTKTPMPISNYSCSQEAPIWIKGKDEEEWHSLPYHHIEHNVANNSLYVKGHDETENKDIIVGWDGQYSLDNGITWNASLKHNDTTGEDIAFNLAEDSRIRYDMSNVICDTTHQTFVILAAGDAYCEIFYSTDGQHWHTSKNNSDGSDMSSTNGYLYNSVRFLNNELWVSGNSGLAYSADGGKTWTTYVFLETDGPTVGCQPPIYDEASQCYITSGDLIQDELIEQLIILNSQKTQVRNYGYNFTGAFYKAGHYIFGLAKNEPTYTIVYTESIDTTVEDGGFDSNKVITVTDGQQMSSIDPVCSLGAVIYDENNDKYIFGTDTGIFELSSSNGFISDGTEAMVVIGSNRQSCLNLALCGYGLVQMLTCAFATSQGIVVMSRLLDDITWSSHIVYNSQLTDVHSISPISFCKDRYVFQFKSEDCSYLCYSEIHSASKWACFKIFDGVLNHPRENFSKTANDSEDISIDGDYWEYNIYYNIEGNIITTQNIAAPISCDLCVRYLSESVSAREAIINSTIAPEEYFLLITVPMFNGDACSASHGKIAGYLTYEIPRFVPNGAFNVSAAMSSNSTIEMSGTAIAIENRWCDKNGDDLGGDDLLRIIDVEEGVDLSTDLAEIAVLPEIARIGDKIQLYGEYNYSTSKVEDKVNIIPWYTEGITCNISNNPSVITVISSKLYKSKKCLCVENAENFETLFAIELETNKILVFTESSMDIHFGGLTTTISKKI